MRIFRHMNHDNHFLSLLSSLFSISVNFQTAFSSPDPLTSAFPMTMNESRLTGLTLFELLSARWLGTVRGEEFVFFLY